MLRVREYLHHLTGMDFATYREWLDYVSQIPFPQCESGDCPRSLIELKDLYNRTPPDPTLWDANRQQRMAPANGPRPDDFIPWLQNPGNGRYLDTARAQYLVFDFYHDEQLSEALSYKRDAVSWLRNLTDQSFDSPERWVQWWHENRSNLILSEDGLKLVVKRKRPFQYWFQQMQVSRLAGEVMEASPDHSRKVALCFPDTRQSQSAIVSR